MSALPPKADLKPRMFLSPLYPQQAVIEDESEAIMAEIAEQENEWGEERTL